MAKDMQTQHTFPNSIPPFRPAGFFKKEAVGQRRRPAFGGGLQPFFWLKNLAGRDVGMEFGDVGCVRVSFAINSNYLPKASNAATDTAPPFRSPSQVLLLLNLNTDYLLVKFQHLIPTGIPIPDSNT